MISLPARVLELMDEGREKIIGLLRFDFGTGTYGFSRSAHPITYDSIDYLPGGILQVSDVEMGMGTAADSFTITLAASQDGGMTPNVIKTIYTEDYADRPVTILDAIYDPDDGALLTIEAMGRGYLDTLDHTFDPAVGEVLTASCESRALDYSRMNARQANSADQARRDVTDTFFDHASTAGRVELSWGE